MKYKSINIWENSQIKRKLIPYLFLMPSLLGTAFFVFIPFMDSMRRAFFGAMNNTFMGTQNFQMVLRNDAFRLASYNTIKFLIICIPLLLAVSLILSFIINNIKEFTEFIKTSFLIPFSIPVASVVLLWKVFFVKNGLLNKFLFYGAGIKCIDWINSKNAFIILVITYLWKNCGYDMILWISGLGNINPYMYEAASLDGCSKFQIFVYITLPNLKVSLFTVTTLSVINSFKVFREAYLIAGDYPDSSIYMMQHLFNNWFISLDIQKMCAAALCVVIFLLLFILIFQFLCERE